MDARSVAGTVEALTRQGYRGDFRAEPEGLRETASGRIFAPEDLVVEALERFEGTSDPDDEAAVFALRSRDGTVRGTWTVAFGPAMPPLDGEMAHRLRDAR